MTHRELSTRTIIRALMQIAALVEFKQKAISLSTLFAIRCYKNLLPGPYYKKISVLYKTILAHSFSPQVSDAKDDKELIDYLSLQKQYLKEQSQNNQEATSRDGLYCNYLTRVQQLLYSRVKQEVLETKQRNRFNGAKFLIHFMANRQRRHKQQGFCLIKYRRVSRQIKIAFSLIKIMNIRRVLRVHSDCLRIKDTRDALLAFRRNVAAARKMQAARFRICQRYVRARYLSVLFSFSKLKNVAKRNHPNSIDQYQYHNLEGAREVAARVIFDQLNKKISVLKSYFFTQTLPYKESKLDQAKIVGFLLSRMLKRHKQVFFKRAALFQRKIITRLQQGTGFVQHQRAIDSFQTLVRVSVMQLQNQNARRILESRALGAIKLDVILQRKTGSARTVKRKYWVRWSEEVFPEQQFKTRMALQKLIERAQQRNVEQQQEISAEINLKEEFCESYIMLSNQFIGVTLLLTIFSPRRQGWPGAIPRLEEGFLLFCFSSLRSQIPRRTNYSTLTSSLAKTPIPRCWTSRQLGLLS